MQSKHRACAHEWIRSIAALKNQSIPDHTGMLCKDAYRSPSGQRSHAKIGKASMLHEPVGWHAYGVYATSSTSCMQYPLAFFKYKPADTSGWCNLHQVWCQPFVHSPDPLMLQRLPYNIKHASVLERRPSHTLGLQHSTGQSGVDVHTYSLHSIVTHTIVKCDCVAASNKGGFPPQYH